jgi:mRNA interferase RelE/StbE
MPYDIEITPTAFEALESIADRRTRGAVVRRIDMLGEEPEKRGKPLRGVLSGFFSVRAAGQRYRVVYRAVDDKKRVVVYLVGMRKEGSRRDVYELAERLAQRGWI